MEGNSSSISLETGSFQRSVICFNLGDGILEPEYLGQNKVLWSGNHLCY